MAATQSIEAWEYNPSDDDQRCEHKFSPNRPVSSKYLAELGVLSWKIDVKDCECNPALEQIKSERGYKFWETITVAPGKLQNYEAKLVQFFQEHLHPYDESRLILEGSGLWDVRGHDDKWIRFRVKKGDMIVLPPGMYHRFTLDTNNYIKAMLLYTEVPTRTDVFRPDGDNMEVRKQYIDKFLSRTMPNILPTPISPRFTPAMEDSFLQQASTLNFRDELLLTSFLTSSFTEDIIQPISSIG